MGRFTKYILFVALIMVSGVFGGSAYSKWSLDNLSCPQINPETHKLALFVLSTESNTNGKEPKSGTEACIAFPKGATSASFAEIANPLLPVTLFEASWAEEEAVPQWKSCLPGWTDEFTIDPKAKELKYEFVTHKSFTCTLEQLPSSKRVRYRMQPPGGDLYLYYIGEPNPKKQGAGFSKSGIKWDISNSNLLFPKKKFEKTLVFSSEGETKLQSIKCVTNDGAVCLQKPVADDQKSIEVDIEWDFSKDSYKIGQTYTVNFDIRRVGLSKLTSLFTLNVKLLGEGAECITLQGVEACGAMVGCKFYKSSCMTMEQYNIATFDCKDQIKNYDCTKEQNQADCKSACIEANNCAYFDKQCKKKSELTAEEQQALLTEQTEKYLKSRYGKPEGYAGPLPDCAFSGTCDNINDLVELFINLGNALLTLVGMFAFAFFMYGGFLMITGFGMEERIKQGKAVLVASIIGIIITFSAYIVTDFVLDSLRVGDDFRAVGTLDLPK